MAKPIRFVPKCDVFGCSSDAVASTDGTEVDARKLGRKAQPRVNHCDHHADWPFSEDAAAFAASEQYRTRKT